MIDEMKRQKRELVYKGSILDIYKDTMQFANGKTEEWDFVSHRKGAAAVLPVLDDGRIIMVRQYRNALERETIEIPAGCRDFVGEDTRLCAERELKEETGYSSDDISFLLSLRTTVAFCDEEVDVYLAKNLKKGEQSLVSVIQIWLKRWLTTARITFLLRLDSLCLHRLISQTRVYFHSYSNHLQFNVVQSKKSSKELFLLCTFFY